MDLTFQDGAQQIEMLIWDTALLLSTQVSFSQDLMVDWKIFFKCKETLIHPIPLNLF